MSEWAGTRPSGRPGLVYLGLAARRRDSGTPLGKADAFQSCALNIDDFRDTPDADIAACFYKKVE
jgi:hypothetical protein